LYAFLAQIATFVDADLEKLYAFGRLLLRRLPFEKEQLPLEIQQAIDLESYRLNKISSGNISLQRGQGQMDPENPLRSAKTNAADFEALSELIKELNQRFGTDFSDDDSLVIHQLEEQLAQNPILEQTMRVNTPENALLTFREVLENLLQDLINTQFKFYKQVNTNPAFAQALTQHLIDRYRNGLSAV
jgi:type I restriction enzyme R subunit